MQGLIDSHSGLLRLNSSQGTWNSGDTPSPASSAPRHPRRRILYFLRKA